MEDHSNELTLSAIRAVAQRASQCSPNVRAFAQSQFSDSSSTDSCPDVVDRLYDAQKRYDKNRAERKREAEEAAKSEIRPGPVINAHSARLASGNAPIVARSEQLTRMRERALECERQLVRERKEAAVTGAPSIHPRSQRLQRTVDDLWRWEDQKQKRRSIQQHRQLEEQKRNCTFKPKVRASSADNRWTRSNGPGSNGKASLASTPTSSKASAFLPSEPLSFKAFQDRLNPPMVARCRSTGRQQWIQNSSRSHASHNSLPSCHKTEDDFSFVDSPEYGSPDCPRNASLGSDEVEPAPEVAPVQDNLHPSEEGRSRPASPQGSFRQSASTSPDSVGPSTGFRLQRQSGNKRGGTASSGRIGKVSSRDAYISPRCTASCSVVEYSCDMEAVLAIARRGGG